MQNCSATLQDWIGLAVLIISIGSICILISKASYDGYWSWLLHKPGSAPAKWWLGERRPFTKREWQFIGITIIVVGIAFEFIFKIPCKN